VSPRLGLQLLRLLPALGGLFCPVCFAAVPLDTVRDCAAAASPVLSGLKSLSTACPDLDPALSTLGLDKILYDGWREKLTVHALQDAVELTERYSGPRRRSAPDTSAVAGIVQALKDEQAPQAVSWWHTFKNWLKQWVEHSDSAIAKWIKHLLDGVLGTTNISPSVVKAFVYIVTILAALAAVIVVVREFMAAGIVARFRRSRSPANIAEPSSSAQCDDDGFADQPGLSGMLRALVRRLTQTGRLAKERSLTHRELIARTSFDNDAQRTAFGQVAGLAETALYGSEQPSPEVLQAVTQQGRDLLQQLSSIERTA
jgi:Domain of unknown function (DUF4129)